MYGCGAHIRITIEENNPLASFFLNLFRSIENNKKNFATQFYINQIYTDTDRWIFQGHSLIFFLHSFVIQCIFSLLFHQMFVCVCISFLFHKELIANFVVIWFTQHTHTNIYDHHITTSQFKKQTNRIHVCTNKLTWMLVLSQV